MPKTRQQKEEIVKVLQEKLGKAKSVVFADYRGLTMKQLSDLRSKLHDLDAEFTITKNTLLKIAMKEIALSSDVRRSPRNDACTERSRSVIASERSERGNLLFDGPTAALFAYDDEISPIKILVKALKDAALGQVKRGFLGVEPLDEARILQLATLPTKDELRGQTVAVLVAPLQGMIAVLQGNLRNLVYALSEMSKLPMVEQKKRGGDAQASS